MGVNYDGHSGKTELSHYLMYKLKYQILKAEDTREVCGMIESNRSGFVYDFRGVISLKSMISIH